MGLGGRWKVHYIFVFDIRWLRYPCTEILKIPKLHVRGSSVHLTHVYSVYQYQKTLMSCVNKHLTKNCIEFKKCISRTWKSLNNLYKSLYNVSFIVYPATRMKIDNIQQSQLAAVPLSISLKTGPVLLFIDDLNQLTIWSHCNYWCKDVNVHPLLFNNSWISVCDTTNVEILKYSF